MYLKLIAIGNLGNDPEVRYTADQRPVARFSLAVNHYNKDGSGRHVEETTWMKITVFDKLALVAEEHLHKGDQIALEGRITPDPVTGAPRAYIDKDGKPRATLDVLVSLIKFINVKGSKEMPPTADPEEDFPGV